MDVAKGQYMEVIKLTPKADSIDRLMEIREPMVAEYAKLDGFVECRLVATEDGPWYDLWTWESKANAEGALGNKTPLFEEWASLVELNSFEWAEVTGLTV